MNRASTPSRNSILPLVSLIAANLLPLLGVYLWGWSLTDLLMLYWLENAVVGLFTVLSMLVVRTEGSQFWALTAAKVFTVPFFVVHYGMFWLGHGFFLWTFFGPGGGGLFGFGDPSVGTSGSSLFGGPFGGFFLSPLEATLARAELLVWPLALMVVSHGVAFLTDFLAKGQYRTVTVRELMMRPYGRVMVLHVTIVIGAFFAAAVGPSLGVLIVFVLVKIVADVAAYLNVREAGNAKMRPFAEVAG